MDCPTCDLKLNRDARTCPHCQTEYSLTEWTRLHSLDYLVRATADWPVDPEVRKPYVDALGRWRTSWAAKRSTSAEADNPPPDTPETTVEPASTAEIPATQKVAEKKEKQSFEQWLFSESTIKTILYSGSFLLILAGAIFVGANWSRLGGEVRLAITLAVTALMTIGGLILLRRSETLRIGALALLAIAAGFAPFNIAILYNDVLNSQPDETSTWILGSLCCLAFYIWLARIVKSRLFVTYAIVASLATWVLTLILIADNFTQYDRWVGTILIALPTLWCWLATRWGNIKWRRQPLIIASALIGGLTALVYFGLWSSTIHLPNDATSPITSDGIWGNPYFAGIVGVLLFAALFGQWSTKWKVLIPLSAGILLIVVTLELGLSQPLTALVYAVEALALLFGLGLWHQRRPINLAYGYVFVAAVILLSWALILNTDARPMIPWLLFINALTLFILTAITREDQILLGGLGVMALSVGLKAAETPPELQSAGYALLALTTLYAALGWRWKRFDQLFLIAAGVLSLIVPLLLWESPRVLPFALLLIAGLYVVTVRNRDMPLLFVPGLAAFNAAALTAWRFEEPVSWNAITTTGLGVALLFVIAGVANKRRGFAWQWPFYLWATLNGVAVSSAIWMLEPWYIAPIMAVIVAGTILLLAAIEHQLILRAEAEWAPTPFALLLLYGAVIFSLYQLGENSERLWVGALITMLVPAAYILAGLTQRSGWRAKIYGDALRYVGFALIGVSLYLNSSMAWWILALMTTVATVAVALDAFFRRDVLVGYGALALGVGALWLWLFSADVTEGQAYAIPAGLAVLASALNERRLGRPRLYILLTIAGLLILLGSAFAQSIDDVRYALLMLVESIIAFGWGVRQRTRVFVQIAIAALLINGLWQFGPAFWNLPRFGQMALAGSTLLTIGLLALFRREQLLNTRNALRSNWRSWDP